MSKKKKLGLLAGSTAVTTATTAHAMKKEADKTTYTAELMSAIKPRKMGFYEKYIKRGMDVICASAAILCFSPIYAGVALLVKIKLGSPVIFTQDRPGLVDKNGRETIFKMYKFRSMMVSHSGSSVSVEWDQKYIKKVGLIEDINIILETVKKAFIKQEGISQDDMATAEDFGDYLLRTGKISLEEYLEKQEMAKEILIKSGK